MTNKTLTPEFLAQHGFTRMEFAYDCETPLPEAFDVYKPTNGTLMLEEFHRQMFCVAFRPGEQIEIHVQFDVGMGFIVIPCGFGDTTEQDFCTLYDAIRREPLRGTEITNTEWQRKYGELREYCKEVVMQPIYGNTFAKMFARHDKEIQIYEKCTKDPNTCQVNFCGWPNNC